jgi:hypothetical protein
MTTQRIVVETVRSGGPPRAALQPALVTVDTDADEVVVDATAAEMWEAQDVSATPPTRLVGREAPAAGFQGWPRPHRQSVVPPSQAADAESLPQASAEQRSARQTLNDVIRNESRRRIGWVHDLLLDRALREIRFIVVKPRRFLPGSRRLLNTAEALPSMDWKRNEVQVRRNRGEFDFALLDEPVAAGAQYRSKD